MLERLAVQNRTFADTIVGRDDTLVLPSWAVSVTQ
jgi:hypothetical protein